MFVVVVQGDRHAYPFCLLRESEAKYRHKDVQTLFGKDAVNELNETIALYEEVTIGQGFILFSNGIHAQTWLFVVLIFCCVCGRNVNL